MGAINYFTSDYITIGIKPYNPEDIIADPDFIDYISEYINIDDQEALYREAQDIINSYYEEDYNNIENELSKYNFYYYHVVIKPGYYEGFTIDIENNFGIAYDDYTDKTAAQKELTQLKKFLISCASCGLVECFPGWCTGYSDYENTLKSINSAIKIAREEIKSIPTWKQYSAAEGV